MKTRLCGAWLALLLACAAPGYARADVRASLDASQIAVGDTVQLTLERDGRSSGEPDLAPLEQTFDILGTSSSTSIELSNGSASEKTEVTLTLAPKLSGRLTIPSLTWDGERSQPLSLVVTGPGGNTAQPGAAAAATPNVFMEMSASPQQPYVQAAVQLTVRLFTTEPLYHADLQMPENGDVLAKQAGADENSEATRNGRSYQVVTRHYLLFPLHSGKLTVQSPVLDAEVAVNQPHTPFGADPWGGAFFGGPLLRTVRPVTLHAAPVVLAVRARPANAMGSYWLPASDVTVSAAWNPTKLSAPAGDPITLDLTVQATGLTAAQLPDLFSLLSLPSGLKAYPDQPKLTDSVQGGALVGSRDQTIAFMADSPGHYAIPALTVRWWDTRTNQPRTATLAAQTLSVLPPPGVPPSALRAPLTQAPSMQPSSAQAPRSQPSSAHTARALPPRAAAATSPQSAAPHAPSEWEWISIGLAVIWLATLAGWLLSRRSRAPGVSTPPPRQPGPAVSAGPRHAARDASTERAVFRAACEANDAHAARAHLLAWATALWGSTPTGVGAIAARVGDAPATELLRDLDRACYAGGAWQGRPLAAALTELPAPGKPPRERDGLAPLYP